MNVMAKPAEKCLQTIRKCRIIHGLDESKMQNSAPLYYPISLPVSVLLAVMFPYYKMVQLNVDWSEVFHVALALLTLVVDVISIFNYLFIGHLV
jgi:hypothetical protein